MKVLIPASYTEVRTKEAIIEKLCAYPQQLCNTEEAFRGFVMEFSCISDNDSRPGALSEFDDTTFQILADDGIIEVEKIESNSKFVVLVETSAQEEICRAHMAGQFDAGCKYPSWSNAFSYFKSIENRSNQRLRRIITELRRQGALGSSERDVAIVDDICKREGITL